MKFSTKSPPSGRSVKGKAEREPARLQRPKEVWRGNYNASRRADAAVRRDPRRLVSSAGVSAAEVIAYRIAPIERGIDAGQRDRYIV